VRQYQDSVRLADIRYDSGLSSHFEVSEAKLDLYPARQAEVQYDLGRKVALINLYKALGGGWRLTDVDWSNAPGNLPPSSVQP
jgi:outer membrane protein, multidrug efflux system